jgi:hypothetical protein
MIDFGSIFWYYCLFAIENRDTSKFESGRTSFIVEKTMRSRFEKFFCQMINDGLRERGIALQIILTSDKCPVIVTGPRTVNDNDDDAINSVVFGADQLHKSWKVKNFLVVPEAGGQYKEELQEKIRAQRPDFSWFFPANVPKYWEDEEGEEGTVFNAEWLATWLLANNFVLALRKTRPTQQR